MKRTDKGGLIMGKKGKSISYWYVTQALRAYRKGAKTGDIRTTIGWSSSHTSNVLTKMRKHGLVRKVKGKYMLTSKGRRISKMTLRQYKGR